MNTKRTIKPHKGGRDDRIYARMTKEAKAKLLARVKAEGYKSLGDWLEAQAMAKPNIALPDALRAAALFGRVTTAKRR